MTDVTERRRSSRSAARDSAPQPQIAGGLAQRAGMLFQGNRLTTYLFYAVLVAAPFPFGSVDWSTIAFWCMVLGVAVLAASPRDLTLAQLGLLAALGAVVLGYVFVLHEHLSDTPWIAQPHEIWAEASKALGVELKPSVSIARYEPYYALGATLAMILMAVCGVVVGAHRARADRTLEVIAWSGAAYALYAILAFIIEPGVVLWREKTAYTTVLTGTFINRNTAATYFGSCAIVWFVLLLEKVRNRLPAGPLRWVQVRERILYKGSRPMLLSFGMFFLCIAAMFMTGSRAGVVLTLMMLVVTFTLFFRRDLPGRIGIWIAVAGGAGAALILLQFMGAGVGSRFETQGLSDAGRVEAWKSTLRVIADHPWFGTGLGTFPWAFPAYRSSNISMWGVWDRAHSTPLELASEIGIPLALLVAAVWLGPLVLVGRRLCDRRRDLPIPLAAFSVSSLALLHSLIDFSLQIPGYALVAVGLLALGAAQSVIQPSVPTDEAPKQAEIPQPQHAK